MSTLVPVRASGLLKAFAAAEVLEPADVHVAQRLGRLGGEGDETVLLAVALAVRGVRSGSTCVDLSTVRDAVVAEVELPWPVGWPATAALESSPLVATDDGYRPLRLDGGLLYLDRYWQQEQQVRRQLASRAATRPPAPDLTMLDALFDDDAPQQRLACETAASRYLSVITGGPGTGKTYTVARLVALLQSQSTPLRIALAAPTGKAAARLQEAVRDSGLRFTGEIEAKTLHRLLGWKPGSQSRFLHDADNHLPYDVVVVDESSMASLTMMARLLEAVRPDARLVLVGDPDQLTSVDAGAVLSDLVARPETAAIRLTGSRRYGGAIDDLAEAVRTGDADAVVHLLRTGDGLELTDDPGALRDDMVRGARELALVAGDGDAQGALDLLGGHRLLCAHRDGQQGVSWWNEQVDRWTGARPLSPGTPLLVTQNDYESRLWNGDTGVVVATPAGPRVAFPGRELLALSKVGSVQTVHAMTVHRSQGSQYEAVSVLLPDDGSAILTRELLYTAVTRASRRVRVVGSEQTVRAAVGRQVVRASGLRRA